MSMPIFFMFVHFGMTLIRAKPWEIAENFSEKLGVKAIAARDGMKIDLGDYKK
ncbi:hypothetical protein MBGDC06_00328 [Thermoplasmatales archaeon SCGC AB-539-C06]|nr:hypothetical protein MBGDC06_00328 [Thermoplasmatales archaeon SCGC AB-539-C06]